MAGLDHAPPPFFKQGPAPLALLTLYLLLSVIVLVVDLRLRSLEIIRQTIMVVVDPVQRFAQAPGRMLDASWQYFRQTDALLQENQRLKRAQLETASGLQRLEYLEAENARLRQLFEVKEEQRIAGKLARIMYATRDPYTRRIMVDKGIQSGVTVGQPAIDPFGIVGQVTVAYPFAAQVTLITDRNQAVPVQVMRTGQRSIVFGKGGGELELRYMPANADLEEGDLLVTSGLDGVYPAGFPVAHIRRIDRDPTLAFAKVDCQPLAGVEHHGEVMILDAVQKAEPPPEDFEPAPASKQKGRKKRVPKASS